MPDYFAWFCTSQWGPVDDANLKISVFTLSGEKDIGFEVSPDEVQPSIGGADDQMDAIPISSSSDSLSTPDELDARATLPTPSDMLVSYSTFPGLFCPKLDDF